MMLSTPAVHKTLFFLSLLFGMDPSLVSKESEVHIDRKVKTGRITYQGIRAPKDADRDPGMLLGELEEKERFTEDVEGIELSMIMFRSVDGELAVEIFFNYEDEGRMCEALGLERSKDGKIRFEPSDRESLISTNGDSTEKRVSWGNDARKLRFELSGQPLDQEERGRMQVLKYIRD